MAARADRQKRAVSYVAVVNITFFYSSSSYGLNLFRFSVSTKQQQQKEEKKIYFIYLDVRAHNTTRMAWRAWRVMESEKKKVNNIGVAGMEKENTAKLLLFIRLECGWGWGDGTRTGERRVRKRDDFIIQFDMQKARCCHSVDKYYIYICRKINKKRRAQLHIIRDCTAKGIFSLNLRAYGHSLCSTVEDVELLQ